MEIFKYRLFYNKYIMNNPFDRVINVGSEKASNMERPSNVVRERPAEKINISFSLNKKWAERGAFLLIIAVLAILAFNPMGNKCVDESEQNQGGLESITGNVVLESQQNEDTGVTMTSQVEEKEVVEEKVVDAGEEEEIRVEEKDEEEIEKPFKQNFDFKIENIEFERDSEEDNRPKKMKSIKFIMKNRWKDFKPLVEAYWYDVESNEIIKEKKRAVKYYRDIKKGETQMYTIVSFDSTFFDPTNKAETVELRLYDVGTGLLMATTKQIIV